MIQIDIEMPKTCGQCFCAMEDYDYNTVRCRFKYDLCFDANSRDYSNRRLDGCPLHEVTDSDTISRQTAYDTLTEYYHHKTEVQHKALAEALSRVPSSQLANKSPKVAKEFGELISRQMAIDAVEESRRLNHHQDGKAACAHEYEHRHFLKLLRDLPSVQPEPPWIPCSNQLPEVTVLCCDTRGEMIIGYPYQDEESNTGYSAVLDDIVMIDCTAWMPLPEPYHRP